MPPRARPPPILKSSMIPPWNPFAVCPQVYSPHVHFPPTPSMTSTHLTHSSNTYDRTPLTITQNPCALPGRGERSYDSDAYTPQESYSPGSFQGSYFHPRAYEACEREKLDTLPSIPSSSPLINGLPLSPSSESDKADDDVIVPDPFPLLPPQGAMHSVDVICRVSPIMWECSKEALDNALSFVPHASELTLGGKGGNKRSTSSSPSGRKDSVRCRSGRNFNGHVIFATSPGPPLDGCLGGF